MKDWKIGEQVKCKSVQFKKTGCGKMKSWRGVEVKKLKSQHVVIGELKTDKFEE